MKRIGTALFLDAVPVERVWGGNRLGQLFGPAKETPAGKIIGESWELSDRAEVSVRVRGGPFAGRTFSELRREFPQAIMGAEAEKTAGENGFPLLVKFVDSGRPLSIQVHPDDEQARSHGDHGKAEGWVILHAAPGARLIRGLKPGTTRELFEKALRDEKVEEVLHSFPVSPGDVVALPPGMIHAIGEGIVLAEFQQSSDITYRVWDYGRLGLDGKPRQLHVEEALATIRFADPGDEFEGDLRADTVPPRTLRRDGGIQEELLLQGRFFELRRFTLAPGASLEKVAFGGKPSAVVAVEGRGLLTVAGEEARRWEAGRTVFLPTDLPAWTAAAEAGGKPLVLLAAHPGSRYDNIKAR